MGADSANGRRLLMHRVVAADIRFCETGRTMGIAANMHDFAKTMLVCRMAHSVVHEHINDRLPAGALHRIDRHFKQNFMPFKQPLTATLSGDSPLPAWLLSSRLPSPGLYGAR